MNGVRHPTALSLAALALATALSGCAENRVIDEELEQPLEQQSTSGQFLWGQGLGCVYNPHHEPFVLTLYLSNKSDEPLIVDSVEPSKLEAAKFGGAFVPPQQAEAGLDENGMMGTALAADIEGMRDAEPIDGLIIEGSGTAAVSVVIEPTGPGARLEGLIAHFDDGYRVGRLNIDSSTVDACG